LRSNCPRHQAFAVEVTDCPHIVWKNGHHVCSIVEKRSVATRHAPCEEIRLITVPELAAEALGSYLAEQLNRRFGSTDVGLTELIPSLSRLALDCIGNSDALYHNVEHTMLVTLVGHEIMSGRALLMPTSASDYAHVVAACLFHDIGYGPGHPQTRWCRRIRD
jgi:hypothetical protein